MPIAGWNRCCVDRIMELKDAIKVVYVGIKEPDTFIAGNSGKDRMEAAGVPSIAQGFSLCARGTRPNGQPSFLVTEPSFLQNSPHRRIFDSRDVVGDLLNCQLAPVSILAH